MSIWDTLFGRQPDPPAGASGPGFRFGRYTDAHKPSASYRAWDRALAAFEDGDFLTSVTEFLTYLGDPAADNVRWQREGDRVYFEFYQGSKRVTGQADADQLRASARIARLEGENAELLHRLTGMNYELKYGRFAIDAEDCLTVVFDTPAHDASPHKLYHAFKEIALRADKQDDLLLDEFADCLSPVEITHLRQLRPAERQHKLDFLTRRITTANDYLAGGAINPEEHPGGVAYLLLDLVYRLDYLLLPEGHTMEALERMHRMYFARETERPVTYKNVRLLGELQGLLQRAPASFAEELYVGKSTFGITLPASHDRLASLIDGELPNVDWYQNNGYPEIARAIPGYITGYALFNFATPAPDRDLLHLYYRVTEDAYFRGLGYRQEFLGEDGRPARRPIRAAVADVVRRYRDEYPHFRPVTAHLRYDDLVAFGRSFLEMIREVDLSK